MLAERERTVGKKSRLCAPGEGTPLEPEWRAMWTYTGDSYLERKFMWRSNDENDVDMRGGVRGDGERGLHGGCG